MSTVDKMLIKGIRSFDPENNHVITFFKPLTLIVGPNGAGKTTIIECLKLSCTGELPPNARSGHSFIHDPKVAGETETKGQIKLRFKTAARKDVVCIRSFQLTQKPSKMEYKAIESVLQTINPHTGEKVCLSYRCADMDREIPSLMGVSKAILENVIFVHQDDANWPLQDPSTLKKKFDDIFSATRYTKALEVIKKLHKDQAQEIKTYKLKLDHLETLKDAASKLRQNIGHDEEKTELIKHQIQELERNIQVADSDINNTEMTLKELRQLQEKASTKTTERTTLFKEQQKQYAALSEENEDADEELQEWKNKFDERIALLESKVGKLEREMKDNEYKSSQLRQTISDFIWEVSKLQSEADAHYSLKCERDLITQQLFEEHNLGTFPKTPFSEDVSSNLISQIKAWLIGLGKGLQEKKISNESELEMAWGCYMAANDRWKDVEAQKQAKFEIKNGILRKIKEKKRALDSFEHQTSDANIQHIEEREKNLKLEVDRKSAQLAQREFDLNLRKKENELFSVEQQIKGLVREKDMLAADSEDRVKLALKRAELENHVKKHKRIMDEHRDNIKTVLKGRLPSEKDLKKEINHTLRVTNTEFDEMSVKSREAEKEVNVFQAKLKAANDSVSKLQKDMDSRKRFLESKLQSLGLECFGIDSYITTLDVAKEKKNIQKSKYNIADGMRQMFDPFERVARAHHICPCCERPFSTEEEDIFVRKQRVKAANSSEHMKILALESSNADSRFEQLDKLRMVYEEYNKLCKESILLAERNSSELTKELDQKSQSLDDVLGVVAQIKADKDFVEALIDPVETANRLLEEMQNLKVQVDDLEYKLDFRGQGIRSTEEIQVDINAMQKTRDNLREDMEKLRDERRYMENDLSNIQIRWHTLREEKVKTSNMLRDVQKVEEDLNLLAEEKVQADLDEKHLMESTGPLLREKDQLLGCYNDLKAKFSREYDMQAEQKRNYEMQADVVLKVSTKIKEYNESKKEDRLIELKGKHTLVESQLEKCEVTKEQTFAELVKCKELMQNQGQLRRNIEDNLHYRKTKAEVDKLALDIEAIEDKILKIGGISTFETRLGKILQDRERLVSELNRCHGTNSVYESNISKHKVDLKQTQYKDIDKRYFNQMIQLKTTEMANKDLDRYYNALDKALMRFHSMKMEEINKIIRDLWMQTYRGQDIDYISIHSDSEGSGTRSYSYRVVMQTGDAELEMRGRCSAGQKVLASLIIRLALAETFCLNCGILALDEPTTNLDGPNAESLAAALLRIMEDRKDQENFQLIVITHDERFAQLIGRRQHAERYYRVAKDDHQHSIIESQQIFE